MANIEKTLIAKERNNVNFNVEELTNVLDGSVAATKNRRIIEHEIQSMPEMKATSEIFTLTREQRLKNGLKRAFAVQKYFHGGNNPGELVDVASFPIVLGRALAKDISLPIHAGVFIPTIVNLGSPEQVEKWVQPATEMKIIGTYSQTELGHGSFLRGLEMTAVYEPNTKQFRLNCPSITAMKWWPGDLGLCANHTVVMAQLIINGKSYGMHAFIVQIRDMETHMPMPGVEVGVIGDKLGFENVDNGYLYLKNVKIPRENLLCRFTKVAEDGSYSMSGNPMMLYGSMLLTRVNLLIPEGIIPLQMACTIATRYSVVRRQGKINESDPEVSVMEYQTQQGKVLPQVAKAYAFHFAVKHTRQFYLEVKENMDNGDFSLLPEVHALAAAMKSHITESALQGTEICRRSCGGHGYLQSSGLPFLVVAQMASVIYEGENTVMYLQCARYLLKCQTRVKGGDKIEGLASYLNDLPKQNCGAKNVEDFFNPKLLQECFKHRAQRMVNEAAENVQKLIASGKNEAEAKNLTGIELAKTAQAHVQLFVLSTFVQLLEADGTSMSSKVCSILNDLCALHGVHTIIENSGEFIMDGYVTSNQYKMLVQAELQMLNRLRPNAVGIVDAFDFTDTTLRSALGSYDGNVYERLFEHAKNHPMNKDKVHPEIYELLRPYLKHGASSIKVKANL